MKGGLGRGLSSLIPAKKPAVAEALAGRPDFSSSGVASASLTPAAREVYPEGEQILHIPPADIVPNPYQPRTEFRTEELEELVSSIKEFGVLQPLVVTEKENGMYELIAGERRLRASKAAGLKRVPVIVRTADAQRKLEIALIENIQRADLSPIEEAHAYAQLVSEFSLTQEEVGKRVGKSRPTVANILRLLNLPDDMQKALADGMISMSMARVLCGMDRESERRSMFERMVKGDYTVREAEKESRAKGGGNVRSKTRDVNLMSVEEDLRGALGTKVSIQKKRGSGSIKIDFYSEEEFAGLVDRLKR